MASHLAWAPVYIKQWWKENKPNPQSCWLHFTSVNSKSTLSYYSSWIKKKKRKGKEKSGLNQIIPNPHTLPQTITQSYNPKVVEWFNHKYPGRLVIGLLVYTAEMEWLGPLVIKGKERSIMNGFPLWSKVVKAAFR